MNTYELCSVEREDIPECVRVIRESFMTVADEFGYNPQSSPLFTGFLISEERLYHQFDVEKRPMFCAKADGETVGFCSVSPPNNGRCEINNLAVLPRFRHKKIGEALLINSLKTAKSLGCREVFVDIVAENLRLRKWYESFGFVYTETVRLDGYEFLNGYMIKKIQTDGAL